LADDSKLCEKLGDGVTMIVYAVVDETISPTSLLGDAIDVFLRREDAQRFIEEVDGDDPELARLLRIEERELEVGRHYSGVKL
jgi:hypothetical protein